MICANCGSENGANAKFCRGCGKKRGVIAHAIPANTASCLKCGFPNESGKKFCKNCGAPAAVMPAPISTATPPVTAPSQPVTESPQAVAIVTPPVSDSPPILIQATSPVTENPPSLTPPTQKEMGKYDISSYEKPASAAPPTFFDKVANYKIVIMVAASVIALLALIYIIANQSKGSAGNVMPQNTPAENRSAQMTQHPPINLPADKEYIGENIQVAPLALPETVASFLDKRGLRMPTSLRDCGSEFKLGHNPFFAQGDFDGDGRLDYAIDAEDINHVGTTLVFLASGRIHELQGWSYIYTDKRRGLISVLDARNPSESNYAYLKYDAIGGVRCDSSSAIYVYNDTKSGFEEFFTGD